VIFVRVGQNIGQYIRQNIRDGHGENRATDRLCGALVG